jgi:hypothetical protein
VPRDSNRVETEAGDLYVACRYIGSNQMPSERDRFGDALYADAVGYYAAVSRALHAPALAGEPPAAMIRRVTRGIIPLAERTTAIAAALDDTAVSAWPSSPTG